MALIIPSEIRKEYNIDASTVLALRADRATRRIILQAIRGINGDYGKDRNIRISAGKSLAASSQQISSGAQYVD